MQDTIKKNLLQIQEEIAPYTPKIIAVTKYFDEEAIIAAYNAGLKDFGESRVIEAIKKINNLPAEIRNNSKCHFIGHLQTNKVKKAVENFDYIHSVDSVKLAKSISDEAKVIGKVQNILLQVNNANEEQKFGFSRNEIFTEFEPIMKMPNLNITGLMNMAPLEASDNELRKLFTDVINVKKALEEKYNCELKEISMGMSQDYKIAAQAGSTILRVGRKLFNK